MKVLYVTHGTRGDVQPHLALALALVREGGHEVTLAVPPEYLNMVIPPIKGVPINMSISEAFERPVTMEAMKSNALIKMIKDQSNYMKEDGRFEKCMDMIKMWAESADVLVGGSVAIQMVICVAELYRKPFVAVALQPALPSSETFIFSGRYRIPRFIRLKLWKLLHQAAPLTKMLNDFKSKHELQASSFWEDVHHYNFPFLMGYSPSLFPPPSDWAPFDYAVCGSWRLDDDDLNEAPDPPDDLVQFLDRHQDAEPVYIGWGSMASESGEQMVNLATRALFMAGRPGVLFKGSTGSKLFDMHLDKLPKSSNKPGQAAIITWAQNNILIVGPVSHRWLFPRMSCVVHHGGAGTLAAALQSGTPSIVTPFAFDQYEHARLSVSLGVGPAAPRYHKLSPAKLAAIIGEALSKQSYKTAAISAAHELERESKLAKSHAVQAFERMSKRNVWVERDAKEISGVSGNYHVPGKIDDLSEAFCRLKSQTMTNNQDGGSTGDLVDYEVKPPKFFLCFKISDARARDPRVQSREAFNDNKRGTHDYMSDNEEDTVIGTKHKDKVRLLH